MTFNISSAKDITTDKSTYLIYAKPGTGKHTQLISYPVKHSISM